MQKSISASVCSFLWAAAIEEHTPVRVKTENWDKIPFPFFPTAYLKCDIGYEQ